MQNFKELTLILKNYHETKPEIVIEGFMDLGHPETIFYYIFHNTRTKLSHKITVQGVDNAILEITQFIESKGLCYDNKPWSAELQNICRTGEVSDILQFQH